MNVLEAMNTVLPFLQSPEATSEDSRHPMAVRVRSAIQNTLRRRLAQGFWFNTLELSLAPAPDGRISVPSGALEVSPVGTHDLIETRGTYLYNLSTGSPVFSEPLQCRVVQSLQFQECPELFQAWVMWEAAYNVYSTRFDAADSTAQLLGSNVGMAEQYVRREHLRHRRFRTVDTAAGRRILSALRGV